MEKLDLLLEAERRGILPADKVELLTEARNRGLIPALEQAPSVEQAPSAERFDFASATPEQRRQMKLAGVKSAKNITAGLAGAVPSTGQAIIGMIPGGERVQQSVINMLSGAGSQPYEPGMGQESINALIRQATGGEPTSGEAQAAKLMTQIGLTLGAPGAAAKSLAALRAPIEVTRAIGTGGFGAATIPGRIAGGAAAGGIAGGVIDPESMLASAALGGALPIVSPLIAGTSSLWQKAFPTAEQKAAKLLQKVAGPEVSAIRQAASVTPEGQLVAPAIADIQNPQMQALAETVARRDASRKFTEAAARQEAEHLEALSRISGGRTQLEARRAAESTKRGAQEIAGGMREEALLGAEEGTKKYLTAEVEAAANRELASKAAQDVRRFEAAGTRAGERAATTTTVPGQPRVPGRYTYMGELEKKAGEVAGLRAAESLEYGAAARSAEQRLQDLKNAGVEPLNISKIDAEIGRLVKDPKAGVSPAIRGALGKVSRELKSWSDKYGTINADALSNIRSNVINEEIRKALSTSGASPTAIEKQTAELMGQLKPFFDDVIEKAGGSGWKDYLKTYEQGMNQFRQSRMGAELADLYKNDPQSFVKVVKGENLDPVQRQFGYGRYDLEKEMGSKRYAELNKIADDLQQRQKMQGMAEQGKTYLGELLKVKETKVPGIIPKSEAINYVLDTFRNKLNPGVLDELEKAFTSGKNMRELLELVPRSQKAEFADKLLEATRRYGAVQAITSNNLAPENRNALNQ